MGKYIQDDGEGDLPIHDAMMALNSINYEGYITLEWVKRWAGDLSDAGLFSQFENYMRKYIKSKKISGGLFYNKTKTGRYYSRKIHL